MQFQSDAGKQNGLYWPAAHGQKRSPLGDLLAQAAVDPRASGERVPLHGYYFKILPSAGGFGLVAWPAQYDVTGVMTFIVNQDGIVFQTDLGPQTAAIASRVNAFDPDISWAKVEVVD